MDIAILPELPPEVMLIVLSNLGRKDLLNCRLVSNFWNKVCIIQLKKSKYTIRLDLKRITSYIEFTKRNLKFVLPFHIDLNMVEYEENFPKQILPHVPLHELDLFKKNLKLLINRFGPECVVGLDLYIEVPVTDRYWDIKLIYLTELFFIVSTDLKMLDLKGSYINSQSMEHLISKIKQHNIKFPNLKKLKINNFHRLPAVVQFILENSPRMKNLKMNYKNNTPVSVISAISIPFEKLKTLKLGFIQNPSEFLLKIQECQFLPTLQKLRLSGKFYNQTEAEIYHDILESFSKTLKTLEVVFSGSYRGFLPTNFPNFPKLQYLKIKTDSDRQGFPIFLNPNDAKFNPATFLVLKYITFPIDFVFMPEDSYEQLSFNNSSSTSLVFPIFTNIIKLTIIIHDWDLAFMVRFYQKYVKHLQLVFANVTSVVIVNKCDEEKHHVKQLIQELIQSDLASNIQNMTFSNFDQDHLGQVLKQLSSPPQFIIKNVEKNSIYEEIIQNAFQSWTGLPDVLSITYNVFDENNVEKRIITLEERNKRIDHKMTNIHTIKYEEYRPMSERQWRLETQNMMLNELKLTMMVKHFPNIRQIGISSLIFGQDDKQKCTEEIQNLRIQFPNIAFDII